MFRDYPPAYIRGNFELNNRLAVVLINRSTGSVIQRISTAEKIAAPEFQRWLHERNGERYDVFISMNALRPEAQGRRKQDIGAIRHVYLDFDHNGEAAVQTLFRRKDLPVPSYVLNTSPGKYQVTWIVKDFEKEQAEQLQRSLAREMRADPAATDSCRVMRLPYFFNHKYGKPYLVRAEAHSAMAGSIYTPENFPQFPGASTPAISRETVVRARRSEAALSQSERDWAYAKRAVARGESPALIAAAIASYRRFEKHNPQYYAELTVRKAAEALRNESPRDTSTRSPER